MSKEVYINPLTVVKLCGDLTEQGILLSVDNKHGGFKMKNITADDGSCYNVDSLRTAQAYLDGIKYAIRNKLS